MAAPPKPHSHYLVKQLLWRYSLAHFPAGALATATEDPKKKVLDNKLGSVKRFKSRNYYDFISGNNIKEKALSSALLLYPKDHGTFPF